MGDEKTFEFRKDHDHPGWSSWRLCDATRYNAFLGKLIVQRDGDLARLRMFPTRPFQSWR